MEGRPLMNEWLKQELETANAAMETTIGPEWNYWNGYADAITNALHELTGMSNE